MFYQENESWIQEFTTLDDFDMTDNDSSELTTTELQNENQNENQVAAQVTVNEPNTTSNNELEWDSRPMGMGPPWYADMEQYIEEDRILGMTPQEIIRNFLDNRFGTTLTTANNEMELLVPASFLLLNPGLEWTMFVDSDIGNTTNDRITTCRPEEAQRLRNFLTNYVEESASDDVSEITTPSSFLSTEPEWSMFVDSDIGNTTNDRITTCRPEEAQRLRNFLTNYVEESASDDVSEITTPSSFLSTELEWSMFVDSDIGDTINKEIAINGPEGAQELENFFQNEGELEVEPEGPEDLLNFEGLYTLPMPKPANIHTGIPPLHSGISPRDCRKRKASTVDEGDYGEEEHHTARTIQVRENIGQHFSARRALMDHKRAQLLRLKSDLQALDREYKAGYLSREEARIQHADRNWYDKREQKYIRDANLIIDEMAEDSGWYLKLQEVFKDDPDLIVWLGPECEELWVTDPDEADTNDV